MNTAQLTAGTKYEGDAKLKTLMSQIKVNIKNPPKAQGYYLLRVQPPSNLALYNALLEKNREAVKESVRSYVKSKMGDGFMFGMFYAASVQDGEVVPLYGYDSAENKPILNLQEIIKTNDVAYFEPDSLAWTYDLQSTRVGEILLYVVSKEVFQGDIQNLTVTEQSQVVGASSLSEPSVSNEFAAGTLLTGAGIALFAVLMKGLIGFIFWPLIVLGGLLAVIGLMVLVFNLIFGFIQGLSPGVDCSKSSNVLACRVSKNVREFTGTQITGFVKSTMAIGAILLGGFIGYKVVNRYMG